MVVAKETSNFLADLHAVLHFSLNKLTMGRADSYLLRLMGVNTYYDLTTYTEYQQLLLHCTAVLF